MRKSKNLFIISSLISLITILVYLPALQNDFVNWDDPIYVYENHNIFSIDFESIKWMLTSFHAANWHPLTWFSHSVDYAIWGLNPIGHHLTSVIFHGLNTFLVVVLITYIIRLRNENSYQQRYSLIAGAITGLLFGLHPLHVESVAWVSERKDVLYAFFFLLSILMYIKYVYAEQGRKVLFYGLCLGFFILSLMSKPMAVTLPAILFVLDFYPLERLSLKNIFTSQRKVLMEKIPFFVLNLASSVITVIAQQKGGAVIPLESHPLWERVLIAIRGLGFYLYKMVWPTNLAPWYPAPSEISIFTKEYTTALIIVAIITTFCIYSWRKQKSLLAVWIYYLITLLPVLGIIKVGDMLAADRYTYLPSLGPFLLIGLGASKLVGKAFSKENDLNIKKTFVTVLIAVTLPVILSILTINQIKIWKDSETLWNRELALFPFSATRAYNNLGIVYRSQGLYEKAVEYFKIAIKINPQYIGAHNNLGVTFMSQGLFYKAIEQFKTSINLDPTYIMAYNNLGKAYMSIGLIDMAIEEYQTVLEMKPDIPEAHNNLGVAFKAKGSTELAIYHYEEAIRLKPNFSMAYYNLGNIYMLQGFIDKAMKIYIIAIKLNPKHANAHYKLAISYSSKGLTEKADEHYRIARQLNPTMFKE